MGTPVRSLAFATLGLLACAGAPAPRTAAFVPSVKLFAENDPRAWIPLLREDDTREMAVRELIRLPELAEPDEIVGPLTEAYVDGRLRAETSHELLATLAAMRRPRALPAFVHVLAACTDDVFLATTAIAALARDGVDVRDASEAAWRCAITEEPRAAQTREAVMTNAEMLAPRVTAWLESSVDHASHLDARMALAGDVLARARDARSAPTLLGAFVAAGPVEGRPFRDALLSMPRATIALAATIPRDDRPRLEATSSLLADLSTTDARDAVIDLATTLEGTATSFRVALKIPSFPATSASMQTFERIAAKAPVDVTGTRQGFAWGARFFFSPAMIPWLVSEARRLSSDASESADATVASFVDTAAILMTSADVPTVEALVTELEQRRTTRDHAALVARARADLSAAVKLLSRCKSDVRCHLATLDDPSLSTFEAQKASAMCAILGDEGTAQRLVEKLPHADLFAALSILDAVKHLAPRGDAPLARRLDEIAEERAKIYASLPAWARVGAWDGDDAKRLAFGLRARARQ